VDRYRRRESVRVTVKAFGGFRDIMPGEIVMDLPAGTDIGGLLEVLGRGYRALPEALFAMPGMLRDYVNILKNGRNIQFIRGLATLLEGGGVVALFPPAAGG